MQDAPWSKQVGAKRLANRKQHASRLRALTGHPNGSKNDLGMSIAHSELVTVTLFFALSLGRLNAHLLIVLLECSEILASLAELSFFHALSDIPMHKRTLRVHQVELVV